MYLDVISTTALAPVGAETLNDLKKLNQYDFLVFANWLHELPDQSTDFD
jgi:hypothetical protein